MSAAANEDQIRAALDQLQEQFPGWRLWPARDCRMVAATRIDRSAGPSATVLEDTVEQLAEALEWEKNAAVRLGL